MKKLTPYLIGSFATVAIIAAVSCATPVTLTPATPASTNSVTGEVTPAKPAITTNLPNATVTNIAATGHQIAPLLPTPSGTLLDGLLLLMTVGAGAVAKYKNSQLNTVQAVQDTIIEGVEAAGPVAATVKQMIAKTALANGVADPLHAAVQAVSDTTTAPK